MKSLRLTFKLGAAFVLIWALAAAWMLNDLRNQMMFSLDQRLVASARMVAGLTEQMPGLASVSGGAHFSAEQLHVPGGMACQVSSLRGEVLARSHTTPEEALNLSILLAASVPVGVAMLGCLCLLWLGIGQSLLPLNRMRDALMRRSADSLEPLQIHPLPSELKPLLDTQNQLLQRIAKTIERERRLTGDAAHELRSPLTAIKTHLQVARMTEGAARDQSLAHAEEGADRLHRTLEQLLLLARVEGSLSFDDGLQSSAEEVARLAIQDANAGDNSRIDLILPDNLSGAPVEMPVGLAVAALRNLLDNALRHTPADTRVELSVFTSADNVVFRVRDHGKQISTEDLQYLTQRFWRNGNSEGCGLGLAIVQAIVQRCSCSLKFDSQPDGLRVDLGMPLRR